MFHVRPSDARGHTRLDWLNAKHSFSFGEYQDPKNMGFRALRVINEDVVSPSGGFAPHGHRNMEILTYVLEGELHHKDSLGNGGVLKHGVVQVMSAGSGVRHSEFNGSDEKPLHLLQIWILPEADGLPADYNQTTFPILEQKNKLHLLAAPKGEAKLVINQDARVYAAALDSGTEVTLPLKENRYGWVQVARGSISIGGQTLKAGDALAISEEGAPIITTNDNAEFLFFDLA